MNNANCYALESKAKLIYNSDEQQQYYFHGQNFVKADKSVSLISGKDHKKSKPLNAMKKSNSFLHSNKKQSAIKAVVDCKDKSKITKKCLNISETANNKKPPINSKNSFNKTSCSIASTSHKPALKVKKRSISRDFLMLDQQIYECDNIDQINQKLVCGSSEFYSHERFIKATLKNQAKLQRYLTGMLAYIKYCNKNVINLETMSKGQKTKLYNMLKLEANNISKKETAHKSDYSMQNILKDVCQKIEKKIEQTIKEKPHQQVYIRKWQNQKMHQLLAIHSCLNQSENKNTQVQQDQQMLIQQLNFNNNSETNSVQKFDQQKSTSVGNKEEELEAPRQNINNHFVEQKYPTNINSQIQQEITRYLPENHYLSDLGIQSFLHDLWNYIVDQNMVEQFIINLRRPYGLPENNKKQLLKIKRESEWLQFQADNSTPILKNELFIQFCKACHNNETGLSQLQQKCGLILHKAIFDYLNIELTRFQTDFPFGVYHPLQKNSNNSAYLIDEENSMQVWDECLQRILNGNRIGLGRITEVCQQQVKQHLKRHNEQSFKKYLQTENEVHIWNRIQCLTYRYTVQNVIQEIENLLWKQMATTLIKF